MKHPKRLFAIREHSTSVKRECLAGLTVYFTTVYIIAINSRMIADSGIPPGAALLATVLVSFLGSLLTGLWANAPIILIPGMGINALFSYTFVQEMGLSWQAALGVVVVSGAVSLLAASTKLADLIADAIPESLKKSITAGIGMLITFIGLQKGGLITSSDQTVVGIGDLGRSEALWTLFGLALIVILHAKKVPGSFLAGMLATTALAIGTGHQPETASDGSPFSLKEWLSVFGAADFEIGRITFWGATLILSMVVILENVGLLQGLLEDKRKFRPSFQAVSLTASLSGLAGTSPTVCSLESAAGIAAGGRTGLTAVVTGILYLATIPLLPWIGWIPDSAVAAVLITVGGLMIREVQSIPFSDLTEGIPAFITLSFIPFTFSIPDGIAFGFIAHALFKTAAGRRKEVRPAFFVISALFLFQLALHA
ncbi:NCS2 family permease [Staphylospora marina]|uniref:NCS2 family permease n=1 Tax=Staphylospora marina TaxID=2490858 RepID=UPI000F5B930E|nr:NCS2 family permease [Staphylospora marina]